MIYTRSQRFVCDGACRQEELREAAELPAVAHDNPSLHMLRGHHPEPSVGSLGVGEGPRLPELPEGPERAGRALSLN